jgi:hypothetical protein
MKKTLLILAFMLLPNLAMAAPDFNGRWVMNTASSDANPYPYYLLARPPAEAGGPRRFQFSMTVQQSGDTMKVTDIERPIRHYVLDGKPHSRPTDTRIQNAEVTANLQGNDLVIETTEPYSGMAGNVKLKQKEVWSLSPDGKTLTINITRNTPAREKTIKQVFEKAEGDFTTICSDGCMTIQ